MTDKKSFILYASYYDAIRALSYENIGKLLLAVFAYEIEKKEPDNLPSDAAMAFLFIRSNLDRDDQQYAEKCEKARYSANCRYHKEKKSEPEQIPMQEDNTDNSKRYGSMNNVELTEDEYRQFREKYPKDYEKRIEKLSLFMASNGRTYDSHYATLCKWALEDDEKKKPVSDSWENSPPSYDLEKAIRDTWCSVPKLRKRPGAPKPSPDT